MKLTRHSGGTKLTLHMEKQLVDSAKEYASSQGKSVSKMKDFKNATLSIYRPKEFYKMLASTINQYWGT